MADHFNDGDGDGSGLRYHALDPLDIDEGGGARSWLRPRFQQRMGRCREWVLHSSRRRIVCASTVGAAVLSLSVMVALLIGRSTSQPADDTCAMYVAPSASQWWSEEERPPFTSSPSNTSWSVTLPALNQAAALWWPSPPVSLLPPAAADGRLVGRLSMSCSVDASGSFGCDLPFDLPPGSAGFEPHLSLSLHSSKRASEALGAFASISGISLVQRCPRTLAQDGYVQAVQHDDRDAFCLDGVRLVPVDATRNGSVEYRLQFDRGARHLRVRGYWEQGAAGALSAPLISGPSNFVMWLGNGEHRLFGRRQEAQVLFPINASASVVSVWLLSQLGDSNGNTVDMNYTIDRDSGSAVAWLSSVDYTGHSPSVQPYNRVTFQYLPRPDVSVAYTQGLRFVTDRLLSSVVTWSDAKAVRSYNLSYERACAQGRSRLSNVTMCAVKDTATTNASACLAHTQLQWTERCLPVAAPLQWRLSYPLPLPIRQARFALSAMMDADMQGTGLLDQLLIAQDGSALHSLALNDGAGGVRLVNTSGLPSLTVDPRTNLQLAAVQLQQVRVLDLDGDHHAAELYVTECNATIGHDRIYRWQVNRSLTLSTADFIDQPGPPLLHDCSTVAMRELSNARLKFGDFDADGDMDVLHITGASEPPVASTLYLNQGDGVWTPSAGPALLVRATVAWALLDLSRVYVIDLNGDGLQDLYVVECGGSDSVYLRTGRA